MKSIILCFLLLFPCLASAKSLYFAVPSPNNATSGSTEHQLLVANRDHMISKVNDKVHADGKFTHYVWSPGTCFCKDTGTYKIWEGWLGDWERVKGRHTEDDVDTKRVNWRNNETFEVDIEDPLSGITTETITSGVTIKMDTMTQAEVDALLAGAWYRCTHSGDAIE